MGWVKNGLVFEPAVCAPWVHAQVPTAFWM
jgi:hypothetical protein